MTRAILPLTGTAFALIDSIDAPRCAQFAWQFRDGHAFALVDGVELPLPNFILGVGTRAKVRHANNSPLDNRRCNLRTRVPLRNRKPASDYHGVTWDGERQKWRVSIRVNGQVVYVGRFSSELDAAIAYDDAARKVRGLIEKLNFPGRVSA